ncbi:MAG: hypothetical protein V4627_05330 [Pseudomonadota bacterium]
MQDHDFARGAVFEFSPAGTLQHNWARVLVVTSRSWNLVATCRARRRLVHPVLRWAW